MPDNTTRRCQPIILNGIVERWHQMLISAISCNCQKNRDWLSRLPIILLVLRATSGLWPQPAPVTELTLELYTADFYKQLQKLIDGYTYPPAVHHQQDDDKASDTLQKAKSVLVHQDGHKPPLAYRGPYRTKLRGTNSYVLEGGNESKNRVAINHLKPFHVQGDKESVDLQPFLRHGRPGRVAVLASPRSPTPSYSPPDDEFLPLASDTPPGHCRKFNL